MYEMIQGQCRLFGRAHLQMHTYILPVAGHSGAMHGEVIIYQNQARQRYGTLLWQLTQPSPTVMTIEPAYMHIKYHAYIGLSVPLSRPTSSLLLARAGPSSTSPLAPSFTVFDFLWRARAFHFLHFPLFAPSLLPILPPASLRALHAPHHQYFSGLQIFFSPSPVATFNTQSSPSHRDTHQRDAFLRHPLSAVRHHPSAGAYPFCFSCFIFLLLPIFLFLQSAFNQVISCMGKHLGTCRCL